MTFEQRLITIGILILGTVITRFLPFVLFGENRKTPEFVQFIGKYLPSAVFAMLVVYCLKDVSFISGSHGAPEFIAIAITVGVHLWRRQMLISITAGTVSYMLLLHLFA